MPAVAMLLDQLHIMTYGFYGSWDPLSGHNAPLYAAEGADSTGSAAAAFRLYHETFGVPAPKINLGVPFYGHAYAQCGGPNQPQADVDTLRFPSEGAFFRDLAPLAQDFVQHRDGHTRVPYLLIPAWNTLVSYDDEESVREKTQFVVDVGAWPDHLGTHWRLYA